MIFFVGVVWWFLCFFVSIVESTDLNSSWKTYCTNVTDNTEPHFLVHFEEEIYQHLKLELKNGIFDDFEMNEDGVFVFLSCMQIEKIGAKRNFGTVIETAQPLSQKLARQSGALPPDGYFELSKIEEFLSNIARDYPGIASLVDMSEYGPGKTFEGRTFPVLKISDNAHLSEDEPRILINGAHHAREIVTPQLCMEIITWLTTNYKKGSNTVRSIVDSYEIFIAPVWNPDGYSYVWTDNNNWRKNRFPNSDGTFGVDQNRNYDLGWDGGCPGSSTPSSGTYRGTSPSSEPETKTMVAFTGKNNFAKVMDFHSSGREVLLGYRCEPLNSMISDWVTDEGTILSKLASGYGTRLPSADGEHQEMHIADGTSYSFLVETATSFQPSFADAQAEWKRVMPLVQGFLERPITLSGYVTGDSTGPVKATITIKGVANITRFANPEQKGRYHLYLPVGQHEVTFDADPWLPQTIEVNVRSRTDSIIQDVKLILPSN